MSGFWVYIIKSNKTARYYIGHTEDVEKRLQVHNRGEVRSTKYGLPWKVVYTERYPDRHYAVKRELQIKKYKGGAAFKKLVTERSTVG